MPSPQEESPGEDYFNDLSQQPSTGNNHNSTSKEGEKDNEVPKPKRIACVLCRKRKLKCDGDKPACGTCTRLQHDCSYDEVRRKSGPKRGYVKALEARLAQVETMLKTQDDGTPNKRAKGHDTQNQAQSQASVQASNGLQEFEDLMPQLQQSTDFSTDPGMLGTSGALGGDLDNAAEEPFPWEMIGLGLDEPLPAQEVINELNQVYFDKIHPAMPMIHQPRYYAAMNLAPHVRPPVCLRYAMWANAASVTNKYENLQEHFYQRARKYIQQDEMKGHGESMITIAHCQTWVLLATYEFKLMYFPRAWMSSGRACRMSQMMGLHRVDGQGLDVKQCLPPPRDWTEREERRRTFWSCFCVDRYSSIGTGWPMTIEEQDISTVLPTPEEAYELNKPAKTIHLREALEPSGPANLSSFSGVVLMACLFGRNLTHLHRPSPDDRDDDVNGDFWKRHREMDNILLHTALALPEHLRLPCGLNNANVVFMNMNIHTSTICLHQAAIFKADKNRMPARISAESKVRCITAAAEIASIMRQISHLDTSGMHPFISFCLYVAARVFVQYLKSRPKDDQVKTSLQFLLTAMHAIKRKNPLTESFLVQLDVDLEHAGLQDSMQLRAQLDQLMKSTIRNPTRSEGCPMSEWLGMDKMSNKAPHTYGDNGLAAFTHPRTNIVDPSDLTDQSQAFGHNQKPSATNQFNLPNRQRTPGSGPGTYQSPGNFNPEMDTSPDGSSNDHLTPGSSTQSNPNQSSHTSHTGYSPQNQQQGGAGGVTQANDLAGITGIFDPNDASFNMADFSMSDFPMEHPQQGFVLPQNWAGGSGSNSGTGLTPGSNSSTGATGIMAGFSGGGLGDMMPGMSDADWNQVLESFTGWEGTVEAGGGGGSEIFGAKRM
ncbi:transcriptional regulatory [Lecanosticta acicola]|uniref:Transcriptional regulatory n=1 Tax=Lecanosticta acicola TaxID=111012 RepID=A0AAI8Z431_9PEZI|nr:transcriptional regulatory [Lecanosticta acicola]